MQRDEGQTKMTETTIVLHGSGIQTVRHLDIQIAVEATVNIDAQTAKRRVTGWLLDEVGNMLMGGIPQLVIAQKTIWRVPALLYSSERGLIGEVGVVDVDADSGAVLADDQLRDHILSNVEQIASPILSPIS
jgi:hypothetical protein